MFGSGYALAAVGLLGSGWATPVPSAPVGSQSSPVPKQSRSSAPGRTPTVLTFSMAPFTLPQTVSRPTISAAGHGLLVVGGLTTADTTTEAVLRIDLPGGAVKQAGRRPVPVHDAAGAVVNSRDLLFGGGSTAVTSAVQDVTPGSSSQVVNHLPPPRADLVAISDGSAGYVLGGFDGVHGSSTILQTRNGKTFTVVGTLPVSVRYPAVAVSGGSIWLFGGEHSGKQITDVQRIDLTNGHGSVVGHLPHPLAHAGAFVLGRTVFVAGGRVGAIATDVVMRFAPANLSFTPAGHLPAGFSDFGVAVVGGTAYLAGGESPKPLDIVTQVRARTEGTP